MRVRMRSFAWTCASQNVSSLWMRRSAWTQQSACSAILNWPAPSETMTASVQEAPVRSQSSPTTRLRLRSGRDRAGPSGSVRPSFCRWAMKASRPAKRCSAVSKTGDGRLGQLVLAHVSERSFVDDIVVAPGPQQLKKIQPALGAGGCEERKAVIADMGAKAVPGPYAWRPYRQRSARTPKKALRAAPRCFP